MPAASVHESPSVINIVLLVKIDCKKMAMLVLKHWIDADDEGVPPSVHTPQMHLDDLIRDGHENTVGAFSTFCLRLVANSMPPFV